MITVASMMHKARTRALAIACLIGISSIAFVGTLSVRAHTTACPLDAAGGTSSSYASTQLAPPPADAFVATAFTATTTPAPQNAPQTLPDSLKGLPCVSHALFSTFLGPGLVLSVFIGCMVWLVGDLKWGFRIAVLVFVLIVFSNVSAFNDIVTKCGF